MLTVLPAESWMSVPPTMSRPSVPSPAMVSTVTVYVASSESPALPTVTVALAVTPLSASVKSAASALLTSSLKSTLNATESAFVGFESSRVMATVGTVLSTV